MERDFEANARDGLAAEDERSASPSNGEQSGQRSARDREAAARDRVEAGLDRAQAATDRNLAKNGIANEIRDHLTGAMGSQFGIAALRREILRTERSDEMLLVAFIEAVAVEAAEIELSQADRDRVLRDVGMCLGEDLRDYDLIARVADHGFICAQSGQSKSRGEIRYQEISRRLAIRSDGAEMKVGLVEWEPGDTFEALLARADYSMLETVG